jgi:hypothetical protein
MCGSQERVALSHRFALFCPILSADSVIDEGGAHGMRIALNKIEVFEGYKAAPNFRNVGDGRPIQSLDGRIGSVSDLYFDDRLWLIRDLVIDSREWLPGGKVLISPSAVGVLPQGVRRFPIQVTGKRIIESPEIYSGCFYC